MGAKFLVMEAEPLGTSPNPGIQNANEGMKKLAIHLEDVKEMRIGVVFEPIVGGGSVSEGYELEGLSEWD